jgi:hypothetical protein
MTTLGCPVIGPMGSESGQLLCRSDSSHRTATVANPVTGLTTSETLAL